MSTTSLAVPHACQSCSLGATLEMTLLQVYWPSWGWTLASPGRAPSCASSVHILHAHLGCAALGQFFICWSPLFALGVTNPAELWGLPPFPG